MAFISHVQVAFSLQSQSFAHVDVERQTNKPFDTSNSCNMGMEGFA